MAKIEDGASTVDGIRNNRLVLYQLHSFDRRSSPLLIETVAAFRDNGIPLIYEKEQSEDCPFPNNFTVMAESDRVLGVLDKRAMAILFNGVQRAVFERVRNGTASEIYDAAYKMISHFITTFGLEELSLFNEICGQMKFAFGNFGSGDRYKSSELLFKVGTQFDKSYLDTHLTTGEVIAVARDLGIHRDLNCSLEDPNINVKTVLHNNPFIDYRREQESFISAKDFLTFRAAYARQIGARFAKKYRKMKDGGFYRDDEGNSPPLIPLESQPILEALVCEELKHVFDITFMPEDFPFSVGNTNSRLTHDTNFRTFFDVAAFIILLINYNPSRLVRLKFNGIAHLKAKSV